LDQAINQLRQALNISPSEGEIAHRLASLYLEQEQWDAAAGTLDSGALLEEDADLFYRLGRAYEQQKRESDAILAYRRALVCQPNFAQAERALQALHVPIEEPGDSDEEFGAVDSQ
jgi:tetratricopeptide (TPR) repeat protein